MRRGFERCIEREYRKVGNYHYEENQDNVIEVYYHNTVILAYDMVNMIYFCDDRGWKTTSTHIAMSGADALMQDKGYKKVSVNEFKKVTGATCYAQ